MNENQKASRVLNLDTMNPNLIKVEYAVRGPIVERALQLENELKKGDKKPFSEIVRCNIGDCHASGQTPITFLRQTISILTNTKLLEDDKLPSDAKSRAQRILNSCSGQSVGSYSHSLGIELIRRDVAAYITRRDNIPAKWENIFLSSGASEAIKQILNLLSTGLTGNERAGIMIPIPQYPLYSAANSELNAYQIEYYLDESKNWALSTDELERALKSATGKCLPRAIVVINPGNPTGQVLPRSCMEDIIRFAIRNNLVLLADEVYQQNIYQPDQYPWTSFKRVLHDMGPGYAEKLELASFMSCSKGYMGECGFRGGYCEITNFDPAVQAQLYKVLSARLCPPVLGQALIDLVVNPPEPDEPSYKSFATERDSVLKDLKFKADLVSRTLNTMPNMSCNPVQGAMYAFPRIHLPRRAIDAAKALGQKPDFFYCLRLLEQKGVCVVPGSGFGQVEGTYHFRITILPPVEKMKVVMEHLLDFHNKFMREYSD